MKFLNFGFHWLYFLQNIAYHSDLFSHFLSINPLFLYIWCSTCKVLRKAAILVSAFQFSRHFGKCITLYMRSIWKNRRKSVEFNRECITSLFLGMIRLQWGIKYLEDNLNQCSSVLSCSQLSLVNICFQFHINW